MTKRFELPEGYHWEVLPLLFGRGRLVTSDGAFYKDIW